MKDRKENGRLLKAHMLAVLLALAIAFRLEAQIIGSPFIENYNAHNYGASVSNFDIHLDQFNRVYIANWNTLLRFDGYNWQSVPITNGKTAYELTADESGLLYVATASEVGYISTDNIGNEFFKPLEDSLTVPLEHILEINAVGNDLYILSPDYLFRYNPKTGYKRIGYEGEIVYTGNFKADFENCFTSHGKFYINIAGVGLCLLQDDQLSIVKDGHLLQDQVIASSATISESMILLCESGDIFQFNTSDGVYEFPFSEVIKNKIANVNPKSIEARKAPDGISLAIGTQKNGVYYFENDELIYHINKLNGLANDEIRDLKFVGNTLWATTQNGISKLSGLGSIKFWDTEDEEIGLVWEIFKHKDTLYIPTTNGLFKKRGNEISKLGDMTERSYYLYALGDRLYLNNKLGIYEVKSDHLDLIHSINSPNQALIVKDQLFFMSNEGLFVAGIKNDKIEKPQFISNIALGQSFSSALANDAIWFSVVSHGILRVIQQNGSYQCTLFSSGEHGLPDDTSIDIVTFDGELLFATNKGFYRLNESEIAPKSDYFVHDSSYSIDGYEISYPKTDNEGNLWFVASKKGSPDRLKKMVKGDNDSIIVVSKPYKILNDQALTIVYPDPAEEDAVWLGGSRGLYNFTEADKSHYEKDFYTIINTVSNNDSVIFKGVYGNNEGLLSLAPPVSFQPVIDFDKNNLSFHFTATTYEVPEMAEFNYRLNGFDEDWSGWSSAHSKEYTNLDPGDYSFAVKSRDVYGNESPISIFNFKVSTPWHLSVWAFLFYILLAIIIIALIVELYTRRLKNQRLRLQQIISDTTSELRHQKEKIEDQNQRLRDYTEQLKTNRDEILSQNVVLEKQQVQISHQNKALMEVNATKDKFFSIIGHDLKNPLHSLTSFANLLEHHLDKLSKEEIKQLAADLNKSIRNSQDLLDNLLNWSRSQTGQVIIQVEQFDLAEILRSNKELLDQQARVKNISINDEKVKSVKVRADINSINMVARNLISNAIKFTHKGGVIELITDETDDVAVVSIRDNGVGISEAGLDKLFRLDAKHVTMGTNKEKGTGLGLILCKEFIDKNNGKIWVKSVPGKGSEFSFSLPKK